MPAVDSPVPHETVRAVSAPVSPWEEGLRAIELALGQVDSAFENGDPQLVSASAQALHDALSQAMHLAQLAKRGGQSLALPVDVTQRLTLARARVRAHQQAVMRGRVAAERALSVLIEAPSDSTYQSLGSSYAGRKAAYR